MIPRVHQTRPATFVEWDVLADAQVYRGGALRQFDWSHGLTIDVDQPFEYYAQLIAGPDLAICLRHTSGLGADWRLYAAITLRYMNGQVDKVVFQTRTGPALAWRDLDLARADEFARQMTDDVYVGRMTWRGELIDKEHASRLLAPILYSPTQSRLIIEPKPGFGTSGRFRSHPRGGFATIWLSGPREVTFITTRRKYAITAAMRAALPASAIFDEPMLALPRNVERWHLAFEWRHPFPMVSWRDNRPRVLAAALGLVRVLPSYVILWILQTDPYIYQQREYRLLSVIDGVRTSVRKLCK